MKQDKTLALIVLAGALIYPLMTADPYFMHMGILIGIYTIGAISINLLLGFAGQLSLGHAVFFGMGAYVSSLLHLNLGMTAWLGMLFASLVSGLLGYVVARLALKLRGAYFVILTIGVAEVIKLVALNWVSLTKGPMGLTDIGPPVIRLASLGAINFSDKLPFYYLVLLFVYLCFFLQNRIIQSSLGRAVISIRENEDLAESIGINCYKHLVLIVVISASITGFSGSLYAHYVSFIDPGVFSFFVSVNLVMMVIGGGKGTLMGPIIGAILFTLIPEWLRIFGDGRMAVYAVIIIFIVIFMPQGVHFYITKMLRIKKAIQ